MAAIVCRGLQSSHLESQIVESRTIRLRLPSSPKPVPHHPQPIDLSFKSCFWDSNIKTDQSQQKQEQEQEENKKNGSWSFLEAISQGTTNKKETEKEKEAIYVHPQQKRSSMVLSPKSLELCTENLGNESGTDSIDDEIISSSASSVGRNLETGEQQQRRVRQYSAAKNKKAKTANFPPPLTTMRGSESVRVRPHRQDGRLLIQLTRVPPTPSCFQAQRSHGRLRLSLLKIHNPSFDPQHNHDNEPTTNDEQEEQEQTEYEYEEGEEDYFACEEKRIEMPRTCKEGCEHENHHNNESLLMLNNWSEPFWVATS